MKTYKALSILLCYPEQDWLEALDEIESVIRAERPANGAAYEHLQGLLAFLRAGSLRANGLIELQQHYVATFDRNPSHSLHMYEHLYGESRDRGPAMIELLQQYQRHGLRISAAELPDYVPLFLEYLSLLEDEQAGRLLADAARVLAMIGGKLEQNASPYHAAFKALEAMSPQPVSDPQEPQEPPVRDMDEAMARFGPMMDGTEPLLTPGVSEARVAISDPKGACRATASPPEARRVDYAIPE